MNKRWIVAWASVLGLFLGCAPTAAQEADIKLSHAHVIERLGGVVSEREVELPYHWDVQHPGEQGEADFTVHFSLDVIPLEAVGMLFYKVGNAFEVSLNGVILQTEGDMSHYNGADHSQVPHFLLIAPSLLQKNNRLEVRIRADAGRRGGLAPVVLGSASTTYGTYLSGYHWRITASLAVAVFSAFISLIAFSLWATQVDTAPTGGPRRDALYLYAAMAELLWSFGAGYIMFDNPPVRWPWWGVMTIGASTWWCIFMTLFCVQVAGWQNLPWAQWFRRWLFSLAVLVIILACWGLSSGMPKMLTLGYTLLAATFVVFCAAFLSGALRSKSYDHRLVALATLVNVIVGVRDVYVFRIQPSYGEITWLRYSSVLFGLTLTYIMIARFKAATQQSRELLATLSARVAQRERELGASFQRLESLARQQERTDERTRILRDMHDGVGSHISSAIRQLQSGQSSSEMVLQTLKDSLDHLKLSIDAMNLVPGDITALLANVRYRLGPRFAAINLELEWAVEELPILRQLDAGAMRQLQFIVFEAFSNVLQHSHAKVLRIEGVQRSPAELGGAATICVTMADNGCGFDTMQPGRRGLSAMAIRASAIGAQLHIRSRPGATQVELVFPHSP
jgi:signal transduction histidine kinase